MARVKNFIDDSNRYRIQNLENLENMTQVHLNLAEHLNVIKRNISQKYRLTLYKLDWKDLYMSIPQEILQDAVIYCDPPYENAKQYQFGQDFDYNAFWAWFRACPYSVYVSSYKAPDDIKPLNFDLKQVNLDNGSKTAGRYAEKKKATENIYWNGKGNADPTFLDLLFERR